MPNPTSDTDQLRFAQIRSRMLDGLAENLPDYMVESSGAKDREDFVEKLCKSESIVRIIDVCAYVAQAIEEERSGRR